MHSHIGCNVATARINGRTLKQALASTKANHRFGRFSSTQWVDVCPKCDAYGLGAEFTNPWPFLCHDGVMRTVADFDGERNQYLSRNMDFSGFEFSESALESAIAICQYEDPTTHDVEEAGATIDGQSSEAELLEFSERVCEWGGGQRVWANLQRYHENSAELAKAYSDWFRIAQETGDEDAAITPGINIKGLGVSFSSKHLRMLDPDRFAVLDEVISEGLGYALNPKGYKLFMRHLREFSKENNIQHKLSTLESGLFVLVRQQVRG
ncbi:MAG: hypothetical protein ABIV07_03340 [Polaromonas sp.]